MTTHGDGSSAGTCSDFSTNLMCLLAMSVFEKSQLELERLRESRQSSNVFVHEGQISSVQRQTPLGHSPDTVNWDILQFSM